MSALEWAFLTYGLGMTALFFIAMAGVDHEMQRSRKLNAELIAERRKKTPHVDGPTVERALNRLARQRGQNFELSPRIPTQRTGAPDGNH